MGKNNSLLGLNLKESTVREKILKSVRHSLIEPSVNKFTNIDNEAPIYKTIEEDIALNFAMQFTSLGGNFIYCETPLDLMEKLHSLINEKKWTNIYCKDENIVALLTKIGVNISDNFTHSIHSVSVTDCEFLISRFGAIVVSSKLASGRFLSAAPDVHIVIAFTSQLVFEIKDALIGIKEKYNGNIPSMISIIRSASSTTDIEKTIVKGMHGPNDVFLFLIDDINKSNDNE